MGNEREQQQIPFAQGPYLSAAFLCEKVLTETDSVKSAIRILDRVILTATGPTPPEQMEPFDYSLALFLKFKSGRARGPMHLEVRLERPDRTSPTPISQTIYFEGEDDRGIDIIGGVNIKIDSPGLHWFDVYLEGVRITRIPLRIVYLTQSIQTHAGDGG